MFKMLMHIIIFRFVLSKVRQFVIFFPTVWQFNNRQISGFATLEPRMGTLICDFINSEFLYFIPSPRTFLGFLM